MKIKIFFLITLLLIITGCSDLFNKGKKHESKYPLTLPSILPSLTLKGDLIVMRKPEAGTVTVTQDDYNKLYDTDELGNPRYFTSDIVSSFRKGTDIALKDNNGIAIRFKVPRIKKDDYLIIDSEITLPEEIEIQGVKHDRIFGSFRYDSKNSNKYEYIMIIFNKANASLYLEGEWQISLSNHDEEFLVQKFNVVK